jgi:hypothetical protein
MWTQVSPEYNRISIEVGRHLMKTQPEGRWNRTTSHTLSQSGNEEKLLIGMRKIIRDTVVKLEK